MSVIVNARDVLLAAASPRLLAPANAAIILDSTTPIFQISSGGVATPTSITFTARLFGGLEGIVAFSASGGTLTSISGNTCVLLASNMPGSSCTVTASLTYRGTVFSTSSVVGKVVDGAAGAGTTTYTWIKYGTSAAGAGLTDDPTGMTYIGLAQNKTTATESTIASDYTWSLFQGGQGLPGNNGADGVTTYTWLKYSDFADGTSLYDVPNSGTLYIGLAVNKTTATESTLKTDYVWSKFRGDNGVPGDNGVRGAGHYYAVGSVWSDTVADAATPGANVLDDVVTISNGTTFVSEKKWTGSAWVDNGVVIDGNLIVNGSVTSAKVNTNGLVVRDAAGNAIVGVGVPLATGYEAPGTKNNLVSISSTGVLSGGGGGQVTALPTIDMGNGPFFGARDRDDHPLDYPVGTTRQFKTGSTFGFTSVSGYFTLETVKQFSNNSGGGLYQYALVDKQTYRRYTVNAGGFTNSFSPWVLDLDRNSYTGDLNASSDINFIASSGVLVEGNTMRRTLADSAAWDQQVYTPHGFVGGAFASVIAFGNTNVIFGLNTDPTTDANWTSIDFAVHLNTSGGLDCYESNNSRGALGTYLAGDMIAVKYDGSKVTYEKNGVVLRTVVVSITAPLFFDSSFYGVFPGVCGVRFVPLSSNAEGVAANAAINHVTTGLATKLNAAAASTLTGTVTISTSGSILAGTTTNGSYHSPTGFFGVQGGVVKFSVPTSGDPTFAGQLGAAYGSFGGVTIAAGGSISSGQTAYNTGTGWHLSFIGGVPKLSIGNPTGNRLTFDGTTMEYVGGVQLAPFSVAITGTLSSGVPNSLNTTSIGTLTASVTGGRAPLTYLWNGVVSDTDPSDRTGVLSASADTNSVTGVSAKVSAFNTRIIGKYTLTVTDADNRVATATRNVSTQFGTAA